MTSAQTEISAVLRGSLGASPFQSDGRISGYGSFRGLFATSLVFVFIGVLSVAADRIWIGGDDTVSLIFIWIALYNMLSTIAAKYVSAKIEISLGDVCAELLPSETSVKLAERIAQKYRPSRLNSWALTISASVTLLVLYFGLVDLLYVKDREFSALSAVGQALMIAVSFFPVFFLGVRVVLSSTLYHVVFKEVAKSLRTNESASFGGEIADLESATMLEREFNHVSRSLLTFWLMVSVAVSSLVFLFDDLFYLTWVITIYSAVVSIGIASIVFVYTSLHIRKLMDWSGRRFTRFVNVALIKEIKDNGFGSQDELGGVAQILLLKNQYKAERNWSGALNAAVSVISPILPLLAGLLGAG